MTITKTKFVRIYTDPVDEEGGTPNNPIAIPGPPGASSHWIVGTGAPSIAIGVASDMYLDSATSDVYGPRTDSAWGLIVANIRGLRGLPGVDGVGLPGTSSKWIVGTGVPNVAVGAVTDMYLNSATGDVYGPRTNSAWGAITGNIKGIAGTNGIDSILGSYTWTGKPSASAVAPRSQIRITDYGASSNGSIWETDGANWRPLNGRCFLKKIAGSLAVPAAQYVAGSSPVQLVIPGGNLKIPAGMLLQSSILQVSTVEKIKGTSGMARKIRIGTSGTAFSGSVILDTFFNGNNSFIGESSSIFTSSTVLTSTAGIPKNNTFSGGVNDASNNINTALDMYLTIDIEGGTAPDSYNLIALIVELIQ